MKRNLTDEEKQQELVIMRLRQGSLLWLGVCLLLLWVLPHPHGGVYEFVTETGSVGGGFPDITRARWWIGLVAWIAVADYVVKPWYVRWRWRKWFPLGM